MRVIVLARERISASAIERKVTLNNVLKVRSAEGTAQCHFRRRVARNVHLLIIVSEPEILKDLPLVDMQGSLEQIFVGNILVILLEEAEVKDVKAWCSDDQTSVRICVVLVVKACGESC